MWGIWWTWDARLTTTLVLWLIYVSYLILRRFAAGSQTQVLSAVLAIFGFVDVPIVYMSIRWFRTQHPSPVMGGGENSGLDPGDAACVPLEPAGVHLRWHHIGGGALPLAEDGEPSGIRARATGSPGRCAMTGAVALKAAYAVTWIIELGYCAICWADIAGCAAK